MGVTQRHHVLPAYCHWIGPLLLKLFVVKNRKPVIAQVTENQHMAIGLFKTDHTGAINPLHMVLPGRMSYSFAAGSATLLGFHVQSRTWEVDPTILHAIK